MNQKLIVYLATVTLALGASLIIGSAPSGEDAAPAAGDQEKAKEKPAEKAAAESPTAAGEERGLPAQDPAQGAIEGRMVLEGDPPVLKPIEVPPNNQNHAQCAPHVKDERVLLSKAREVKNAVVFVANHKPARRPEPREISLDNKDCAFVPHIQATTVGSTLKVTSSDPFPHNTHTYFDFNANFAVYKGDPVMKKLPKEGKVLINCDFHPWMQAWIRVFGHDLFATSTATGSFKIANVPPGEHEVEVWHEVLETPKQKVKVEAGKMTKVDFVLRARKKSGP